MTSWSDEKISMPIDRPGVLFIEIGMCLIWQGTEVNLPPRSR